MEINLKKIGIEALQKMKNENRINRSEKILEK
jgi:hypothetical protein